MAKWADYLISEVDYDDDRISEVKQHEDGEDSANHPTIVPKSTVVSNIIDKKKTYLTAPINKEGKFTKGDNVIAYEMDREYFIRTDGNKTKSDNLGSLPPIKRS